MTMRYDNSSKMVSAPKEKKHKSRPPRTTHRKWNDKLSNTDDRSRASEGSAKSGATPISLVLPGQPLTRDLSDLSGSYIHSNTHPRGDDSVVSFTSPWRQARFLSSREPIHPQPPQDCGESMNLNRRALVIEQNDVVEVEAVKTPDLSIVHREDTEGRRAPVLILLMDPARKVYEIMQIWIDVDEDTVRDVLQAVQQNLGNWRQDYDGLFQVRNTSFSQLIHILHLFKFDVRPNEIFVAKPWSMAAKTTVGYAGSLLNHLKSLGILSHAPPVDNTKSRFLGSSTQGGDTVLVLSPEARKRMFVPNGIFKHYHACQFLSFSPSFEAAIQRVDVLGGDGDDGSASQLSENGVSQASHVSCASEDRIGPPTLTTTYDVLVRNNVLPPEQSSSTSLARNRSFEVNAFPATTLPTPSQSPTTQLQQPQFQSSSSSSSQQPRSMFPNRKVSDTPDKFEPLPVPPPVKTTERRPSLGQRLRSLCSCRNSAKHVMVTRQRHPTSDETLMMESMTGALWKVWEETSKAEESVVSESAPLLLRSQSDWVRGEHL